MSYRLLPVHHFLVTVTVHEELRGVLRACPNEGYEAIFATGSQTIHSLLQTAKWLGSDNVGFFGVLQTWGEISWSCIRMCTSSFRAED